jgi:transcriptional regulator with GAF, ATPase, and Fis domain
MITVEVVEPSRAKEPSRVDECRALDRMHNAVSEGDEDEAYVVVRDGHRWREVFRLVSGLCLSIGRESTNRIVVEDDRCSRRHCEVFSGPGGWIIRDLGSSNGTQVNDKELDAPYQLTEGDRIGVGSIELLFTHNIAQPLTSTDSDIDIEDRTSVDGEEPNADPDEQTAVGESDDNIEPEILEQKARSRYRDAGSPAIRGGVGGLYRMVADMVNAPDNRTLSNIVLKGLTEVLTADIGAVLLLTEPTTGSASVDQLRLHSFQAPDEEPYHRVSDHLSKVTLETGNGTLALDFSGDATAGSFQTLERMNAKSVICAPIRLGEMTYGLIHLYSLTTDRSLDEEALEFTLAVAEHMAGIVAKFNDQAELAKGLARARGENRSLREMLEIESDLIGESDTMKVLRDEIARFAVSDATSMVRGESGVGKELVARAIHFNSPRSTEPFVTMNCAALTESLLESELFGHEKGAFTGATDRKIGKFEQSDGGTLFLDEVGEMSQPIQAKFLRVLEGHPFERIGGDTPVEVNVRVVAATNRDLEQAVRDNEFRRDLFFRLNILEIEVPPLRDRRDDVILLASHFLELAARKRGGEPKQFSPEAAELMRDYDWPGNVRELRNTVERAHAITPGQLISLDDVRFSRLSGSNEKEQATSPAPFQAASLKDIERQHIQNTLDHTNWVKREAARLLGIERSTLDRKLKSYDIERPESPANDA